jgi:hypothetical protein
MSTEEAGTFNVDEPLRRSLVRLDSGKVNIAPPAADAKWFRLVSVDLGNASDLYPNGDSVQAVETWLPPSAWDGIDSPTASRILDDIDAGMPKGSRYSAVPSARRRARFKPGTHARTSWRCLAG